MRRGLAIILAAGLAAGCATTRAPEPEAAPRPLGSELVGRSVHVDAASGQGADIRFLPDGVAEAEFGGRTTRGNWVATGSQLCFSWAGRSRECWPYTAPFEPGETVTLTSDRGNVVRVTLR